MATDRDWEIIKIIIQAVFNGVFIGLGAWLAFIFAERGRRNDIYYRKRFDAYQEATGLLLDISLKSSYLYTLVSAIRNVNNLKIGLADGRDEKVRQYADDINKVADSSNHYITMMLPYEGRVEYLRLLHEVRSAMGNLWILNNNNDILGDNDIFDTLDRVMSIMDSFNRDSEKWILTYVRELDIPNIDRIVGNNHKDK